MGEQGEQRGGRVGDGARRPAAGRGAGSSAVICRCGRPSWRNAVSRSSTTSPPWRTTRRPSPVNAPRSASSTPWRSQRARSSASRSGGTATTIRSWASDSQISHGARPGYLSGTAVSSTSAPTPSAISPTADDSPPAPQSVIAVQRWSAPVSTSISSFSVTGSPICTLAPATSPVVASIVALENVAPRMPSRPGAPAEHDDAVARERPVGQRPVGGDADAPAEHQRVRREAGVVEHGAGDGRQADLVAVVGDAVDHAVADAPRVQRAVGQLGDRQVGRAEAQHVGDGDRAVGGAEHVADHAADAGVGAAERLDGRRVVVRLGLEGDRRALDERHDAGVADERRAHERARRRRRWRRAAGRAATAARCRRRRERRRGTSCGRSARSTSGRASPARRRSGRGRAPRSGRGWRPARPGRGPGRARRRGGRGRRRRGRARRSSRRRRRRRRRGAGRGRRARRPVLDDRVGDEAAQEHVGIGGDVPGGSSMRRPGGGGVDGHAELGGGVDDGVGGAVGHAGVQRDLDVRPVAGRGRLPRAGLQQRVGEERAEAVEVVVVEVALDEHEVGDADGAVATDSPSAAAPAAMAAARGSSSRDRTVKRRSGRRPDATGSTLRRARRRARVSERKVSTPAPVTAAVAPACGGG